jgi:nucleoside-diphosphate-sugar epimerase
VTGPDRHRPPALIVTGAQGFLGRHLVRRWLAHDPAAMVVGVGRSPALDAVFTHDLPGPRGREPAPVPAGLRGISTDPRFAYRRLDLDDTAGLEALFEDVRPVAVVHCAAALRDEPLTRLLSANVLGSAAVVRAVGRCAHPRPRLVLVSSGAVTGRLVAADARRVGSGPADLYAVTKLCAEHVAAVEAREAGADLVIARVFNLLGAGLQDRHLPGRLAVELEAVRRGLAPPVLRLSALGSRRDLVDVDDAAHALVVLAGTGRAAADGDAGTGVVDVGTGVGVPIREVVSAQIDAAGLAGRLDVIEGPARPLDVPTLAARPGQLAALGVPVTPLGTSLLRMADYARHQVFATG